jgi:hypothetical protein
MRNVRLSRYQVLGHATSFSFLGQLHAFVVENRGGNEGLLAAGVDMIE